MTSTSLHASRLYRVLTPAATALVLIGLGATPSSARQDPGPATTHPPTHDGCLLLRLGTQFVRCDNLTGNGVAAPGWIALVASARSRHDVSKPDPVGARSMPPKRSDQLLTTSGSFASGFAWSSNEHFETTVDCGTFDARVSTSVSDRFTVSFDSDGAIADFTEVVWAPRGVWTNTRTGATVEVQTHYVQVANRIPGTQRFTRTVTGTTSLVGQPGEGVTIKEGGRTVHYNQNESGWKDLTGHHQFADTMLTQPPPCAAIA